MTAVDAITSDAESEGVTVVGVALNAAGPVVDPVGTVEPFGAVAHAGVGWLLEHVDVLREPLEALLGDPAEVNANVDSLTRAATQVRQLAREHREDLRTVAEWRGQASDTYRASLRRMAEELESLGTTLDGTAAVVGVSGKLVTTVRGIVFGVVSSLLTELTRTALIAAASAACTFGGSLAAFAGEAGARAATAATDIGERIGRLVDGLNRQTGRLAALADQMSTITDGLDRLTPARTP